MRTRIWLWAPVAVVVAAVAVVTLVVVLNADSGSTVRDAEGAPPARPACEQVVVSFGTDEEMSVGAEALREIPRVASIATHTKADNYERFKEVFADDPELLENTSPDAIPASVEVRPVEGVDADALEGELHVAHSDQVEVLPCAEAPK